MTRQKMKKGMRMMACTLMFVMLTSLVIPSINANAVVFRDSVTGRTITVNVNDQSHWVGGRFTLVGNHVRACQASVNSVGNAQPPGNKFGCGPVDGLFGNSSSQTSAGVREYQRLKGLPRDGEVGPNTWNHLNMDRGFITTNSSLPINLK